MQKIINEQALSILKTIENLQTLQDVDAILDTVLYEARQLTRADAGTIFLKRDNHLIFSYVHNDTLYTEKETDANLYTNLEIPIDTESIVGYVAMTGKMLYTDDAYQISMQQPYRFNSSFDRQTGYRTISMLTLPLQTAQMRLVGVMQMINSLDEQGNTVPFSQKSRDYLPLLANFAAAAIERGLMNRELILRMMKIAELRDPAETGAHVQRVGAYSAEIFQKWATNQNVPLKQIRHLKDLIRLAAMLHDIGKVGISDMILRKPGRLEADEFKTMKLHTIYGARLFKTSSSELDRMSYEIALSHHEKFDGSGYPGHLRDIYDDDLIADTALRGEDIPLAARITALADVYDALSSKRVYKSPWAEEDILSTIQQEAGRHFDPRVVEAFFQILPVIHAIKAKYQ